MDKLKNTPKTTAQLLQVEVAKTTTWLLLVEAVTQ